MKKMSLVNINKIAALLLIAITAVMLLSPMASAQSSVIKESCDAARNQNSVLCTEQDRALFGAGSIWNRVINTFIFIIGIASVFVIMIGGLRYITANGDSSSITSAKNTILYAVVGLVVAISAYAIVNFVITALV